MDRVYTSTHPCAFARYTAQAWARGDLTSRDASSDHKAVEVSIRTRVRPPPLRLKPCVTQHHRYEQTFVDEMTVYDSVTDATARYDAIIAEARSAHRRVLPQVRLVADPPPQAIADVSWHILAHVRSGRHYHAAQIAQDTRRRSHRVDERGILDLRKICTMLPSSLDEATTRDVAALEKSAMPELHKVAKRRKLRLRLEPYRPKRKRLTLHALYDHDGNAVSREEDVGDLLEGE